MSDTTPATSRRAASEGFYRLLHTIPWWAVIIAIIGIIVAFSVLTDVRYLDAMGFLFDFPWDKELVEGIPVQDDTWRYTPEERAPLEPGLYRFFAQFNTISANAKEETALYQDPDDASAVVGDLAPNERAEFLRWHIIPRSGLQMERRWVYVEAEDGEVGWTLDRNLGLKTYEPLGRSETYLVRVSQDATAQEEPPLTEPTDKPTIVDTTRPTLQGPVPEGAWVRLYNKYDWLQTLRRAWTSNGVILTLRATLMGFALALILGLIAGLMLVSHNPITLAISKLYVEVVRGLPMLVIILYAGFVVSPYLREATNGEIDLRGFPGAVIGLGFGYGAYLAEVFRAGIQSIERGQMEAARSLGMSYFQAMRYVVLPQAFRVILPPLGNDFIAMLKDSSLISVVALPEILQQGRLWVSRTFRAFEGYNTVALFYLVMTLILSLLVRVIERQIALPGQREE
jgi:His/Glu/Gln/Arg/opine family amino acid ABC transporter permease subunit